MTRRYCITERQLFHEDIGSYTAYGIRLEGVAEIADISSRRAFVEELVSRINSLELDPVHLIDFVEDSLAK